jgi:acetyl-CoA carboxylase biotin carboxyl carrier protein
LSDDKTRRGWDLAELKRLVNLMKANDLGEVEMEDEGRRVRVVRGGRAVEAFPMTVAQPGPASVAAATPVPPPAAAPAASASAKESTGVEIPSPMVGTFYRSPSPDASPYVEVGDRIGKDSPICIVEAMKVMNEIKAEIEGEILEILVQNGEPVEFGQPLFLVRPTGGAA